VNAGGLLAVHQYTSHMSGIVSSMADNLVLGDLGLFFAGLTAFVAFVMGAACSAILINWGRRLNLQSEFALPLLLEAALLFSFGAIGGFYQAQLASFVPLAILLLCFLMGLQNAIITKISDARIRTTHVTGLTTDLGIEFGKLFYWNASRSDQGKPMVRADRKKLKMLSSLVFSFFAGGVMGALMFKAVGLAAAIPLAALIAALAVLPVAGDIRRLLDKSVGRKDS
jgi:uncharacterized membrane protein YoaK (UPF0700 family)